MSRPSRDLADEIHVIKKKRFMYVRLRRHALSDRNFKSLSGQRKMASIEAANLFTVNGLVAVITGGGSGQSVITEYAVCRPD